MEMEVACVHVDMPNRFYVRCNFMYPEVRKICFGERIKPLDGGCCVPLIWDSGDTYMLLTKIGRYNINIAMMLYFQLYGMAICGSLCKGEKKTVRLRIRNLGFATMDSGYEVEVYT